MGLQVRLYLLLGLMFAILYAVILLVGSLLSVGSFIPYAIMAVLLVGLQYLIGPSMVSMAMRVKWVTEKEEPDLHRMVTQLAEAARIPKPKVGISQVDIPNAFAYGRTQRDARVCVTEPLMKSLKQEELRAVLGHEISHIKHRDMAVITLLSILPMVVYYIAMSFIWSGAMRGRSRQSSNPLPLIGIGLLIVYFITNLLVLYASRLREYYADLGAVRLGSEPRHLATALYQLVVGNARVPRESMRRVEGVKAFFVNDPSRALNEVRELRQVDADLSGTIDQDELRALREKNVRLSSGEKLMEVFTTHPNMLKRIQHLSSLQDAGPYMVAR